MPSVTGASHLLSASPGHQLVAGSAQPSNAGSLSLASITHGHGLDTASATHPANFAGGAAAGTEHVVATQTQAGGNTVLHLHDGSTITVVGVTHIDASFFH
jgi:hypothetical protein